MVKGIVEIMKEACKSCLYCAAACRQGVLGAGGEINSKGYQVAAVLAPDRCTGCGLCARMCPDAALSVYREVD